MENEAKHEAAKRIKKIDEEARELADKKSKEIISLAVHRYAGEYVALASCDIVRPDYKAIRKAGLEYYADVLDVLKIAWSEPRLTFRGILYALPTKLTKTELKELGLRPWGCKSGGTI